MGEDDVGLGADEELRSPAVLISEEQTVPVRRLVERTSLHLGRPLMTS